MKKEILKEQDRARKATCDQKQEQLSVVRDEGITGEDSDCDWIEAHARKILYNK